MGMNYNYEEPLVSVRLMTYKHAEYIAEAIESCLMQQTTFSFEIVIGDDFSTDGTTEICKDFAHMYPHKIRMLERQVGDEYWEKRQKLGRLYNFYNILENCKGKYIALLDGDDYWTDSNKLQMQVDFMEQHEDCFLMTHHIPGMGKAAKGYYDINTLFKIGYLPHASNYMIRNMDFDKYRDAFLNMLGGEMCLLFIAASEGNIYHSQEVVSHYRKNPDGIYNSKSPYERLQGKAKQLKLISKYFKVDDRIFHQRMVDVYTELSNYNNNFRLKVKQHQLLGGLWSN
jgi:glycosyltransferase involved in cell wall biosynthesis